MFALALVAVPGAQARVDFSDNQDAKAAPPATGTALLVARGPIGYMAADRGSLAMIVDYGASPTIAVWNPMRRSVRRFPTVLGGMDSSAYDVALAGNSVAWIEVPITGAHETPMTVMRARLDGASSSAGVAAFTWSPDGGTGNLLGDLHSGGSLAAFDTYYICESPGGDPFSDCPPGFNEFDISEEQVLLLDAGTSGSCAAIPSGGDPGGGDITFPPDPSIRCRQVLATNGPLKSSSLVLAVGGGRIALAGQDGSVEIINSFGKAVANITSTLGTVRAVALDRAQVVLLVRATPWRAILEVHDAATGALEHSLTLTSSYAIMGADPCEDGSCPTEYPTLRLEGTTTGLVAYVVKRTLHLLRVADRRDVIVAKTVHADALHARLDQSGLFYSYDVRDRRHPGRVVHLSWRALAQLLNHHG